MITPHSVVRTLFILGHIPSFSTPPSCTWFINLRDRGRGKTGYSSRPLPICRLFITLYKYEKQTRFHTWVHNIHIDHFGIYSTGTYLGHYYFGIYSTGTYLGHYFNLLKVELFVACTYVVACIFCKFGSLNYSWLDLNFLWGKTNSI